MSRKATPRGLHPCSAFAYTRSMHGVRFDLASRAGVPLYATDEALAHATGTATAPGETLH